MLHGGCKMMCGDLPHALHAPLTGGVFNVKITSKFILAAALISAGATLAYAAGDDSIKGRQDCMKAQGAAMGVFVPIVKGEKPYDAAAIKAAYDARGAACADWANFWTEDSMTSTTLKTRAKPEVWSDKAGFEAAGMALGTAMTALQATTDEAGFKAAFGAVGAACQGCHEKFQAPKE
jgi:cytochrome c556